MEVLFAFLVIAALIGIVCFLGFLALCWLIDRLPPLEPSAWILAVILFVLLLH